MFTSTVYANGDSLINTLTLIHTQINQIIKAEVVLNDKCCYNCWLEIPKISHIQGGIYFYWISMNSGNNNINIKCLYHSNQGYVLNASRYAMPTTNFLTFCHKNVKIWTHVFIRSSTRRFLRIPVISSLFVRYSYC